MSVGVDDVIECVRCCECGVLSVDVMIEIIECDVVNECGEVVCDDDGDGDVDGGVEDDIFEGL